MNDLTILHEGVALADSRLIADKFGKAHSEVLKSVRRIELELEYAGVSQVYFHLREFTNRGRSYPYYLMTRDAFSLLCMGFTGPKAFSWKLEFISAFNEMESVLLRQNNDLEWKQARIQSKAARKSVTDTIKSFVDYATNQGSKSASMYYANITKMEYKALALVEKGQKIDTGFRDHLDSTDLCFLSAAESVCKAALAEAMEKGLHYKECYTYAKDKVLGYAKTVSFARIQAS